MFILSDHTGIHDDGLMGRTIADCISGLSACLLYKLFVQVAAGTPPPETISSSTVHTRCSRSLTAGGHICWAHRDSGLQCCSATGRCDATAGAHSAADPASRVGLCPADHEIARDAWDWERVGSGGAYCWQISALIVFHVLLSSSSRLGSVVCPDAWQCTHQSRLTRFRATVRP